MPIYFAPLEGVTDTVYRRAHHDCFGGVAKYFIPFVSPTQNMCFTPREMKAVDPAANAGIPTVPQVLAKVPEYFLWAAEQFAQMGYDEVNLNLGCPSGTVTGKGKGAGMLVDTDALRRFFDAVFARSPLPVSVKTRLGMVHTDEFETLMGIYEQYPITELTIHARTRAEQYKGTPHRDIFADVLARTKLPLCYNGDLFSAADCTQFLAEHPRTHALMLGRGLIANPALAQALDGGQGLTREALRAFHDRLLADYSAMYAPHVTLGRMREVMKDAVCCFENAEKARKAIRKAGSLAGYLETVYRLFDEHELKEAPHFIP